MRVSVCHDMGLEASCKILRLGFHVGDRMNRSDCKH